MQVSSFWKRFSSQPREASTENVVQVKVMQTLSRNLLLWVWNPDYLLFWGKYRGNTDSFQRHIQLVFSYNSQRCRWHEFLPLAQLHAHNIAVLPVWCSQLYFQISHLQCKILLHLVLYATIKVDGLTWKRWIFTPRTLEVLSLLICYLSALGFGFTQQSRHENHCPQQSAVSYYLQHKVDCCYCACEFHLLQPWDTLLHCIDTSPDRGINTVISIE